MRVLFVIRSLANPGGGAERVLLEVAHGLTQRHHRVELATFDDRTASSFYPIPADATVRRLEVGDPRRSTRPLEFVPRVLALRRLLRSSRPDVAVGFMHSAYVPLAAAAFGGPVPVIASDHIGMHHYRLRPRIERALAALGQGLSAAVTVPSEAARASFGPRRRRRIDVIANPVAPPPEDPDPPVPQQERRVVLAVGRLELQKDHEVLIRAFARVAPGRPGWVLDIVGEGPLRSHLERLMERTGLDGRVRLLGTVADTDRRIRRAALLAVPSRYESFGLATAEALARGVPAIGFRDCPGTDELIVHGENGLLVSGRDRVAALADGLALLTDDAALRERLGAAGPTSVARFHPSEVGEAWDRLLDRVARPRVSAKR